MIFTERPAVTGMSEPVSSHGPATRVGSENQIVAEHLDEIASLLAQQGAGEFRVRAYRKASETVRKMEMPLRTILDQEGVAGLMDLPTIGHSIAHVIEQFLRLGHVTLLDHLRGEDSAETVFATLPTIGPELSRRIHQALEIETLPELMAAAQDGRLARVPGIGQKRVRVIRECLASRLRGRPTATRNAEALSARRDSVPVSELLDVDTEYRRLAEKGKLTKIAPRRFNPTSIAWLPILHTHRDDRHYTALFSNTERAHQLNTTKDWVVIYRDDPLSHDRWTVITSQFGPLQGWRIVRGREDECEDYYLHRR